MRLVILGCGRTGAYVTSMLSDNGHQLSVAGKNSAALARRGNGVLAGSRWARTN